MYNLAWAVPNGKKMTRYVHEKLKQADLNLYMHIVCPK